MIKLAVIGNPIAHSLSPGIHQQFAKQYPVVIDYQKILTTEQDLTKLIQHLVATGYRGCNITLPFKQLACGLVDQLSERAQAAHAVNTLIFESGKVLGDNTDGIGFLRDLTDHQRIKLSDRHILLLGAGGAAHGVAQALTTQAIGSLHIANRHIDRAHSLAKQLGDQVAVTYSNYQDIPNRYFDLVVDATSQYAAARAAFATNSQWAFYYDLRYYTKLEQELPWIKDIPYAHGYGMLVAQAAESFYQWTGLRPRISPEAIKGYEGNHCGE